MPGHSCMMKLLLETEEWVDILEEGYHVDVIYIDFRKAYHSGRQSDMLNWSIVRLLILFILFIGSHCCNFSHYNYISIWPYYIVIHLSYERLLKKLQAYGSEDKIKSNKYCYFCPPYRRHVCIISGEKSSNIYLIWTKNTLYLIYWFTLKYTSSMLLAYLLYMIWLDPLFITDNRTVLVWIKFLIK